METLSIHFLPKLQLNPNVMMMTTRIQMKMCPLLSPCLAPEEEDDDDVCFVTQVPSKQIASPKVPCGSTRKTNSSFWFVPNKRIKLRVKERELDGNSFQGRRGDPTLFPRDNHQPFDQWSQWFGGDQGTKDHFTHSVDCYVCMWIDGNIQWRRILLLQERESATRIPTDSMSVCVCVLNGIVVEECCGWRPRVKSESMSVCLCLPERIQ